MKYDKNNQKKNKKKNIMKIKNDYQKNEYMNQKCVK